MGWMKGVNGVEGRNTYLMEGNLFIFVFELVLQYLDGFFVLFLGFLDIIIIIIHTNEQRIVR